MNESRRANFNKLIDYVQKEYRQNLNGRDYEILQVIATNHSAEEIKQALDYCKSKSTDSLIYLQTTLKQKYYQKENLKSVPAWLDQEQKPEPLNREDKDWAKDFYKKYCNSEEEYYKKIKILEE